jgi:peptidoglycan-N-acetylmuramic acid deacetylase PdaC-like protein
MIRGILFAAALLFAASAHGRPMKIERNSALLEFTYQWPKEAAAVPALDQQFQKEAEKAYREALGIARDNQEAARDQKRDYNPEFYSKEWTIAGETRRLLSLQYGLGTFTGGAHPNTNYGALLWDLRQYRRVDVAALFLHADAFSALTRNRYCAALNAERHKRRHGDDFGGSFDQCPNYSDLAIAPVDKNNDGRFDTIEFVASPYTAGPYVEGEYRTSLPVTSQLINAIRPEYRNSFERQRQ